VDAPVTPPHPLPRPAGVWYRSLLFFPGHRRELHGKAAAAAPDALCLDLEDAVPGAFKEEAREVLEGLLQGEEPPGAAPLLVRINPVSTPDGRADLELLDRLARPPAGVVLPKVDTPGEVAWTRDALPFGLLLVPLVETARGLHNVEEIAGVEGVSALSMGGLDLSAELGCAPEWEPLLYARSRLVHAGALASLPVLDTPHVRPGEVELLSREATDARRLGFTGKLAIHPAQVPVIHAAFTPTEEEVERARRVVESFEAAGGGALAVAGGMVDAPLVTHSRRLLLRAAHFGTR